MARRRSKLGCLGGVLLLLVVLAGALYVADRVAEDAAEQALADYIASQVPVDGEPYVEARGFPFLTQAVRGEYEDVRVRLPGVRAPEVRLARLEADLQGVRLPLTDLLGGSVTSVPVRRSQVRALLAYDDVEAVLRSQDRELDLSYGGEGQLRVGAELQLFGQTLNPSADGDLSLDEGTLRLRPRRLQLEGFGVDVPDAVSERLEVSLDIPDLPFGQELTGLRAVPQGFEVRARGTDVVLQEPPSS